MGRESLEIAYLLLYACSCIKNNIVILYVKLILRVIFVAHLFGFYCRLFLPLNIGIGDSASDSDSYGFFTITVYYLFIIAYFLLISASTFNSAILSSSFYLRALSLIHIAFSMNVLSFFIIIAFLTYFFCSISSISSSESSIKSSSVC